MPSTAADQIYGPDIEGPHISEVPGGRDQPLQLPFIDRVDRCRDARPIGMVKATPEISSGVATKGADASV